MKEVATTRPPVETLKIAAVSLCSQEKLDKLYWHQMRNPLRADRPSS